jgi:PucR C-terminal helix-turn-helix domain/GAF domain/GGDEF-like domain
MRRLSTSRIETSFLHLLVAGAPVEALHAAYRDARADLAGEEERRTLDATYAQVIALHEDRAEDRRRARNLAALSDTAADLASTLDLDALLGAICRRSRLLLGTDAAYVMLRDEARGDTYVHTGDGILTDAFRAMRLPWAQGLGGLVATSGIARSTSDYLTDLRITHADDVDRRVYEEGLRGIAAAPLRRGGHILGVVMSASRAVRHFRPAELDLLATLATHAAIALENARLLETSVRGCHDLEAANLRAREQLNLQRRITAAVAGGGDLADVVRVAGEATTTTLELVDPGDAVLAACDHGPSTGAARGEWRLHADGEWLATLRATGARSDLEVAAAIEPALVALLQRRRRALARGAERRTALMRQVLAGTIDPAEAAIHGLDDTLSYVVLVAHLPAGVARWADATLAHALTDEPGTLAATVDDLCVVIAPGEDADAPLRRWTALLSSRDGQRPTIGRAGPRIGLGEVGATYREAHQVLVAIEALGREGHQAGADNLGLLGMLVGGDGHLNGFADRVLAPVDGHDAEMGTDLAGTLAAFFAEHGRTAPTARRLEIHINTLYGRLARLDAVLGAGWRSADRRLEIHLALRLRQLSRELASF